MSDKNALLALLEAAVCPMKGQGCDGEQYPVGDPHGDYYGEQCQWCYERKQALAAQAPAEGDSRPPAAARVSGGWVLVPAECLRQLRHYTESHRLTFPNCGAPTESEVAAMLSASPTPPGVDGWRVLPFSGSWKRGDERWEVYDPDGSGGVVYAGDVSDPSVRGLLDALAKQAGTDDHDTRS